MDGYVINNYLTLWNDFTHFLVDPVNGDQEEQHENRNTVGGSISYAHPTQWFGKDNELFVGLQERYDFLTVERVPTEDRKPDAAESTTRWASTQVTGCISTAPLSMRQATSHWNDWFRTVLGLTRGFSAWYRPGDELWDCEQGAV